MSTITRRPSTPPVSGGNPCAGIQVERVQGYLKEMRDLSPADLQAVSIVLEAAVANTTGQTDNYKVPGDSDLVIFSIQGSLRQPSIASETIGTIGNINLTMLDRWMLKAQNCLVALQNVDRKHDFFDGSVDLCLAALMPPLGQPVVFPAEAPGIIPASENLQATFTLQDSTASVVGQSSRYGLIVTGVLVPRGARR